MFNFLFLQNCKVNNWSLIYFYGLKFDLLLWKLCSESTSWNRWTIEKERLEFPCGPMRQWLKLGNTTIGSEVVIQQFYHLQLLLPLWCMPCRQIVRTTFISLCELYYMLSWLSSGPFFNCFLRHTITNISGDDLGVLVDFVWKILLKLWLIRESTCM